jgi:hypothetical protein
MQEAFLDRINQEDWLTKIKELFSFLFKEYGFQLIEFEKSESFGDVLVTIESKDFRLRFVRDRGQTFIDICPFIGFQEWFDLNIVRMLIQGIDDTKSDEIIKLQNFLKQNYSKIKELFGQENYLKTKEQLEKVQNELARKNFPDWF